MISRSVSSIVGLVHAALALDQLDVLLAVALADQLVAKAELLRRAGT